VHVVPIKIQTLQSNFQNAIAWQSLPSYATDMGS